MRTISSTILASISFFTLIIIALIVHPSVAENTSDPSACYTAGFSDFSEIVIYFTEDVRGPPDKVFSDAFSDKNIADLIKASITKSFVPCLKNEHTGKDKIVTVLSSSVEQRDLFYQNSHKLTNASSLVIAVKKTYIPPEQAQSGLGGYGLIAYDIYRPNNDAVHLESRTSKVGAFFHKGDLSLQDQLENFFRNFGPLMFKGHAPWGSHLQKR